MLDARRLDRGRGLVLEGVHLRCIRRREYGQNSAGGLYLLAKPQ